MLRLVLCFRPIPDLVLHATPHPTSLALGHLPPGGRLSALPRHYNINYGLCKNAACAFFCTGGRIFIRLELRTVVFCVIAALEANHQSAGFCIEAAQGSGGLQLEAGVWELL